MFELRDAHIGYNGTTVLDGITLTIEQGERVAVIGKSGSGKTSLLRRLYQQQRATAALVPQELGLVRTLSVFHNIYMGRLAHQGLAYNLINLIRPLAREIERVGRIAEPLGLAEKLHEPAGELSGGQQQRVAVARALNFGAKTIVADEPVSALDPARQRHVLDLIADRHETILIAMHDISAVLDLATRVIGIAQGRIVVDEATAQFDQASLDGLGLTDG
ncbi:MAG: ATP-binding cassette domain-containing protein [Alphaproteobacteria bacterium]|nr:ATP-binding cassette domain-containing protein [Alphaproteobacteria bacterium]